MERRGFLAGGAAGTAALAAPSIAAAQPQVQWRCAGSFPKSTDVLWGVLELLSRRVAELTGNAFQIRIFTPARSSPRCRSWTRWAAARWSAATPPPTTTSARTPRSASAPRCRSA